MKSDELSNKVMDWQLKFNRFIRFILQFFVVNYLWSVCWEYSRSKAVGDCFGLFRRAPQCLATTAYGDSPTRRLSHSPARHLTISQFYIINKEGTWN